MVPGGPSLLSSLDLHGDVTPMAMRRRRWRCIRGGASARLRHQARQVGGNIQHQWMQSQDVGSKGDDLVLNLIYYVNKEFIVLIAAFKSSLFHHRLHLVNYGPI